MVRGNRSDTFYQATDGEAMHFTRDTDLTMRGNLGPLTGPRSALIEVRDSCRIDSADNEFPGGALEVRGTARPCPMMSAPEQVSVGDGAP